MRVLVVARFAPWPVDSGGAQRSLAVLEALGQHHDVVLMSAMPPLPLGEDAASATSRCEASLAHAVREFLWAPEPPPPVPPLPRSAAVRVASTLADYAREPVPFAYRQRFIAWRRLLGDRRGEFDAVVVRSVGMACVVEDFPSAQVVLDADDLNFAVQEQSASHERGVRRWLRQLEARRSWRYERALFQRQARVLVANEDDRLRLGLRNVSVVPNGVALRDPPAVPRVPRRLVFVGHCGWPPNADGLQWFLRDVWPTVRQAVPDVALQIVGRDASPETIGVGPMDAVSYHTDVPEVASWFAGATLSVVPLLEGSGTRIKIIESLGYATPVVATPIGASGLTRDFHESDGLFLASTAQGLAEQVIAILRDDSSARAAAEAGARRVRRDWSWPVQTAPLAEYLDAWVHKA